MILLSGVHQQCKTNQNNQQVNIGRFVPGFMNGIIQRFLISHNSESTHYRPEYSATDLTLDYTEIYTEKSKFTNKTNRM